jgi:hypothetical protein
MRERDSVPAEDLADGVRVEDVARHSVFDGAQPGAGATQQSIEVVPPLPAAIIRLSGEPQEPPAQRLVLSNRPTPARLLGLRFPRH